CRRRVFGPPLARGMASPSGTCGGRRQPYGSRRLMFFSSALSTRADWRRWRFRFVVMWVLMWRRKPRRRFTLPFAVNVKRFAAARLVFILGMGVLPLLPHEHHGHLPAFHPRVLLDLRDVRHLAGDAIQHGASQLGMRDRPPPEEDGDLHPMPL